MTTVFPPTQAYWRDSSERYGIVTRVLHWLMAALLLWQFVGMGLRLLLGRDSIASFFVGLHQPVGTVLFLLILVRLIWARSNRQNRPDHGNGFIATAARLGHGAMYVLMLVVPSLALLRAWGGERVFAPFGFEIFPAREVEIAWTGKLAGLLHGELAWVMAVLILGHVGMVIVHERMWRDDTLSRMAGRRG